MTRWDHDNTYGDVEREARHDRNWHQALGEPAGRYDPLCDGDTDHRPVVADQPITDRAAS
jgi:hypothetical protein